jgi:hypothetical protein
MTPVSFSQKDELSTLQDKIRIMQKYGSRLNDEQIEYCLEEERRIARRPEEKRLMMERAAADRIRVELEKRKIVSDELGKRIFVSLNKARLKNLTADCDVPCPECGGSLNHGTSAAMEIADLLRGETNKGYSYIYRMSEGPITQGIPCIHTGGSCTHCGAGVEVLVQLVL